MTTTTIVFAIAVSLFCVGLRIITSKGKILYFLRWPYEWLEKFDDVEFGGLESDKEFRTKLENEYSDMMIQLAKGETTNERVQEKLGQIRSMDKLIMKSEWKLFLSGVAQWIMKPLWICSTCMASVWTIVWYFILNDYPFTNGYILDIAVSMGAVAFLNSIFYALYEMVENKKNCNC